MKFKYLFTMLALLFVSQFAFSQGCPTSHTTVETAPRTYEITFDQTPYPGSSQDAMVDTSGAGIYDVTLAYVSSGVYSTDELTPSTTLHTIVFLNGGGNNPEFCQYNRALPVELINFVVRHDDRRPEIGHLKWTTVNEQDNAGFYIERNGTIIDFVQSKSGGTGFGPYEYQAEVELEHGPNYFTLIQEDFSGETTRYSKYQELTGPPLVNATAFFSLDGRSYGGSARGMFSVGNNGKVTVQLE